MSESETKGLSKNELKKLAKKAEKAAKKQAFKAGGGAAGGAGNAGGAGKPGVKEQSSSPAPVVSTPPPTLKLKLYNGSEGCTATLKAVWASLHYNIDIEVAKAKDLPAGVRPDKKPILIYGNDVVLGGGGKAGPN